MTLRSSNTPARGLDYRMDAMMGRLLQVGVLLASVFVLVGGILYVRQHSGAPVDYRVFTGERASLRHPEQVLRLVVTGDAAAIVQLGVLLLIATPIARVVFAVIAFAVERDRLYVAIGLVVLAVLLFGLLHTS
ncbi:MAG: hypothetical protein JWQ42_56 [Edaphobacter sp.]|nr:hypothetical protein [Edaphobacter sp.]